MRQKRIFKNVLLVLCMSLLGAFLISCGKQEELQEVEFSQREDFTKEEKAFIEAYNEVLATEEIPDSLKDAPSDPTQSDFAIVLLPEKYYGTPAFSFLPLKSRDLTKEELIQLATAYQKASPETILQDYCSYRKGISDDGMVESRRLVPKEDFQMNVSLLEQYAMKGERPKQPLAQSAEKGTPLHFDLSSSRRVWIYPKYMLTSEQILQILDVKYGDRTDDFTPKEGQITYDEAKQKTREVLAKYVTDAEPETIYAIYTYVPGSATGRWTVWVHMGEGEHDHFLWLEGDDGRLIAWQRYGENAVTEEGYSLPWETDEPAPEVSDEQVMESARQYLEKVLGRELRDTDEIYLSPDTENGSSVGVVARTEEATVYLTIDKTDLQPGGITMR